MASKSDAHILFEKQFPELKESLECISLDEGCALIESMTVTLLSIQEALLVARKKATDQTCIEIIDGAYCIAEEQLKEIGIDYHQVTGSKDETSH